MGSKRIFYITLMRMVFILKKNNIGLYLKKLNRLEKIYEKVKTIKNGGIFHGLFPAHQKNFGSTVDEYGTNEEHKILNGFTDSQRLLDGNPHFEMLESRR